MSPLTSALPRIDMVVNDRQLPAAVSARVSAVKVQQRLGLPAQIELSFSDVGDFTDLSDLLAPGSSLHVEVNSSASRYLTVKSPPWNGATPLGAARR